MRRDDSQRRFLSQHSVATLLRRCFELLQHCSSIKTLCCAKNPRCESPRVTSPLWFSRMEHRDLFAPLIQKKLFNQEGKNTVYKNSFTFNVICIPAHWKQKKKGDNIIRRLLPREKMTKNLLEFRFRSFQVASRNRGYVCLFFFHLLDQISFPICLEWAPNCQRFSFVAWDCFLC